MDSADWKGFLARFSEFGGDPTPARYLDLFCRDGTVLHPGMERPLAGDGIKAFIAAALSTMPDFRLRPVRWCARDDVLFVEAVSSGTARAVHVTWPAIYCVTLRGDRAIRGRSYYDRAAILSRLDSGRDGQAQVFTEEVQSSGRQLDAPDINNSLIEPYIANWREPRPERFAEFYTPGGRLFVPGVPTALTTSEIADYYRARLGETPDLRLRHQIWATCSDRIFFEWRMVGAAAGRPFEVSAAERLTLDGGRIVESISYFDTLAFRALRDPSVARQTVFDPPR
jgi:hypothetical protein